MKDVRGSDSHVRNPLIQTTDPSSGVIEAEVLPSETRMPSLRTFENSMIIVIKLPVGGEEEGAVLPEEGDHEAAALVGVNVA